MTKEQEEAIVRLNKDKNNPLACGDIALVDISDLETVLNLLQEKDTRIEELEKALIEEQMKHTAEIEKKDKQINLMAETIMLDSAKLGTFWCNGCTETARCKYNNNIITCIKQYFERKVEE